MRAGRGRRRRAAPALLLPNASPLCIVPLHSRSIPPHPPPSHPCAVWHKRADEALRAAEASLGACVLGAVESSWPIFDALLRSLPGGDGVLEHVGAVWSFAMRYQREWGGAG